MMQHCANTDIWALKSLQLLARTVHSLISLWNLLSGSKAVNGLAVAVVVYVKICQGGGKGKELGLCCTSELGIMGKFFSWAPALKPKEFVLTAKVARWARVANSLLDFGKSTAGSLDVVCLGRHWVKFQDSLRYLMFFLISYLNCLKSLWSLKIPPATSGYCENRKLKNYEAVSKRKTYQGSFHMELLEGKAGTAIIYRSWGEFCLVTISKTQSWSCFPFS